jgi:hypothetical protein
MGYRDPTTVVSPKSRWELTRVLCNTGQGGWAVAEGTWDKEPALSIRWNGDDDSSSPGNPQSHGNPTWFIVPTELEEAVRGVAHKLNEARSYITYDVSVPPSYQHGVFKLTITVEGKLRAAIASHDVTFPIPHLTNRFFRIDPDFCVPSMTRGASPWRGRFKDGVWQCIVETNGIPEDDNPTGMDIVRDALITSVVQSLEPWKPREPTTSTSHHPVA